MLSKVPSKQPNLYSFGIAKQLFEKDPNIPSLAIYEGSNYYRLFANPTDNCIELQKILPVYAQSLSIETGCKGVGV